MGSHETKYVALIIDVGQTVMPNGTKKLNRLDESVLDIMVLSNQLRLKKVDLFWDLADFGRGIADGRGVRFGSYKTLVMFRDMWFSCWDTAFGKQ